jgi:hypothetical protein
MRQLVIAMGLAILFSTPVWAQGFSEKIACYANRDGNDAYKKKLWDGYEISLGPSAHPEDIENQCTGAIYNSAGRVVFRTTGYSAVFDEKVTGKDFDGDGKAEVVFRTDTGGGMHCCWKYEVVSLWPTPHRLFKIAMGGKVEFEQGQNGKMLIRRWVEGPGGFTSTAGLPFAEKLFRVREGQLVDVTPEFCGQILSDETEDYRKQKKLLTPENLKKLEHAGETEDDTEEIVSALLSQALQHVFCHQYTEALRDLEQWPAKDRDKAIKGFAADLQRDYPELAKRWSENPPKN